MPPLTIPGRGDIVLFADIGSYDARLGSSGAGLSIGLRIRINSASAT